MPRTIVVFLLLTTVAAGPQEGPPPGYEWVDLGDGVYVHTRTDPLAGPVDGNAVVIINDEDVFVVDTHIDPAAARAVIARIRALTDKSVSHVINTHWHDDHTNGNHALRQAFPEARFVAHPATVRALEREWQGMEDQRRDTYESLRDRNILAAADSIANTDLQRAIGLRVFAGYRDALLPELPTMELVYPDEAADLPLVFQRGPREIVVESPGPGNTEGDLVVWLPGESILITGDVLVAPIPFAFDAPMVDWVTTLQSLDRYGARVLVPGHGPVQRDNRLLRQVTSLLEETIAAVRDAHADGIGYAELAGGVDLAEQERRFTGGDPEKTFAWRSYFLTPGVQSAWQALGYLVPEGAGPS